MIAVMGKGRAIVWSSYSGEPGGSGGKRPPAPQVDRPLFTLEVGAGCDLTVELARTPRLAIWLAGLVAYRDGFSFTVVAQGQLGRRPFGSPHRGDPDGFRFGIQFADGRKATDWSIMRPAESGLLDLRSMGSGGSSAAYRFHWQVRPLPPPGVVLFACRWNDAEVPETLTEVNSDLIRDAGARSIRIWGRG